jgi:hypothetical protein
MPANPVLPFKLKVAGSDEFRGLNAISTSFRFHGLLQFDGATLQIEWAGSAQVQEVGALTVRDDQLALPEETLALPVERIRAAELAGGWWRPRLEISANDLQALRIVPSENQGMVRFWYARKDGAIAAGLAARLNAAINSPRRADNASPDQPRSYRTPV